MPNDLSAVTPQLLVVGLDVLREESFLPRLVNREFEETAGRKGSTIDVTVPVPATTRDVAPSHVPPAPQNVTPEVVPIPLNIWKESTFHLTDKQVLEIADGVMPRQAEEAARALANDVNNALFALYKHVYGFTGTPGTTPFGSDTSAATQARKVLNTQLAPRMPRYGVLDVEAEAKALDLRAFQDNSWRGDDRGIIEAQIGRKLGFDWFSHQLVPDHTAGVPGGTPVVDNGPGYAIGATTIHVDGMTATTGTYNEGDIIEFAGHAQTYVITADVTADGTGDADLPISPPLQAPVADGEAITLKGDHTVNLAFHRDAFAFASRPLERTGTGLGSIVEVAADAPSGITLRLEVSRQHKQVQWSYDILFGVACLRPELATRIAG